MESAFAGLDGLSNKEDDNWAQEPDNAFIVRRDAEAPRDGAGAIEDLAVVSGSSSKMDANWAHEPGDEFLPK